MKKLFVFFLIISNLLIVRADENENENLFWRDELIEIDEYELVKVERRYKWYEEEYLYSDDYYLTGFNPSEFPYKSIDDFRETEWTEWDHVVRPEAHEDRVIEQRLVNKYRELRPVRYLFFEEFRGGFTTFNISELVILIDGQKVEYNIECTDCSSNFDFHISNNIIDADNAHVNNGGKFRVDLGDYYGINQIKIELYMYDSVPNTKKFKLYMNEGSVLETDNYAYHEFVSFVVSRNHLKPEKYLIFADHSWIVNPVYMDWVYIDNFLNATYFRQMMIANERRYKDIQYRYYAIEKDYLEGYHLEQDESYIKDENEYKDFYQYRIVNVEDIEDEDEADEVGETDDEDEADEVGETDDEDEDEDEDNEVEEDDEEGPIADIDIKKPKKTNILKTIIKSITRFIKKLVIKLQKIQ